MKFLLSRCSLSPTRAPCRRSTIFGVPRTASAGRGRLISAALAGRHLVRSGSDFVVVSARCRSTTAASTRTNHRRRSAHSIPRNGLPGGAPEHSITRFANAVSPPLPFALMWWISHQDGGRVQPGWAQPRSRAVTARRSPSGTVRACAPDVQRLPGPVQHDGDDAGVAAQPAQLGRGAGCRRSRGRRRGPGSAGPRAGSARSRAAAAHRRRGRRWCRRGRRPTRRPRPWPRPGAAPAAGGRRRSAGRIWRRSGRRSGRTWRRRSNRPFNHPPAVRVPGQAQFVAARAGRGRRVRAPSWSSRSSSVAPQSRSTVGV